jgi:hypothetical protein
MAYFRPPPDSDHGYSTMTAAANGTGGTNTDLESEIITPYVRSGPARERLATRQRATAAREGMHQMDIYI